MIKDYFKIESSKATPQYSSGKESNLFGNVGYQAANSEFEKKSVDRQWMDMLPIYNVSWNIRRQELGYLMFLKRNQPRTMKGKGYAAGRSLQKYIKNEE